MPMSQHQQPRRRSSAPRVPNAAPSVKPEKSVVAVAEVLGSATAEVLGTRNPITRGTRASGYAKHGRSPRQPSANNSRTLVNS